MVTRQTAFMLAIAMSHFLTMGIGTPLTGAKEAQGEASVSKEQESLEDLSLQQLHHKLLDLSADPQTERVRESKAAVYEAIIEQFAEAKKRDFHATGEVVNEEGQLLRNVDMSYGGKISTGWDKWESEGWSQVVNGSFDVEVQGWHSMGLGFRKEGYYPVHLSLSAPNVAGIERRIMAGEAIKESAVENLDMTIVMRKIGSRVSLERYRGTLVFEAKGKGVGLYLNTEVVYQAEKGFDPVQHGEDRPEGLLRAEVPVSKNDRLQIIKVPTDKYIDSNFLSMPDELRLIYEGDGGFVHFEYEPTITTEYMSQLDAVGWQMRKAPAEGYVKELVFKPEDRGRRFFYIRHGDVYGRGAVHDFGVSEDGSSFKCKIEIYLQRNPGRRNLETGGW